MKENKDEKKSDLEDGKVDSFTGSPEQQLPDLEAEENHDSKVKNANEKSNSDEQK